MRPIIFDCDGTLVDSERVYARSNAAVFARYGAVAEPDELFARYTGVSLTTMAADIEARYGIVLTPQIGDELEAAAGLLLETELEPIVGIPDLLATLLAAGHAMAVASNSRLSGVQRSLRITGLADYFGNYIATADQVPNPKPAPDVYLMAAQMLGAAPAACLAIEDSPTGVRAARAAGMTVIAFTDPAHAFGAQRLAEAGAHALIDNMGAITGMLDLA